MYWKFPSFGYLLIGMLLALATNTMGQEFRSFPRNQTALYQEEQSTGAKRGFYALKADSQKIVGQDTIIYPMRVVQAETGLPGSCTHNPFDTSWIGPKIVITNNNKDYYFNQNGDSIPIYRFRPANAPWKFYQINDTTRIEAVIDSLSYLDLTFRYPRDKINGQFFFNTNFIRLSVLDTTDTPVNHPIFGQRIYNSYGHGMWKSVNFHKFPNDTTSLVFFGFEKRSGGTLDTIKSQNNYFHLLDYIDHLIGQEFHFKITSLDSSSSFYEKRVTYKKQIILDKKVFGDVDSIKYKYFESSLKEITDANGDKDSIFTIDTTRQTYVVDNYQFLDLLTGEFYDGTGPDSTTGYVESFTDKEFRGRFQHKFHSYFNYDSSNRCLSPKLGKTPVYKYADGLGLIHSKKSWKDTAFHKREKELIYYQRGLETWGNPYNFNNFVAVEDEKLPVYQFRIFPNPVSTHLKVYWNNPQDWQGSINVTLYDMLGRQVWRQSITAHLQSELSIPFQKRKAGVYLLRIRSEEQPGLTKKIIKR